MYEMKYIATYIATSVMCALLVIVMAAKMNQRVGTVTEIKSFRRLTIAGLAMILAQIVWVSGYLDQPGASRVLCWMFDMLDLVATSLTSYFWYRFILDDLEKFHYRRHSNRITMIERIPIILLLIMHVSSPWTQWTFYLDAQNVYFRGSLYWLHTLLSMGYPVAAMIHLARFRKGKGQELRKLAMQLSAFACFPIVGGILQVVLGTAPYTVMALALAIVYLFVSLQETRITTDALTGLANRLSCDETLAKKIKVADEQPFYLYLIDINDFKKVNDNYGHLEGDQALINLANAIMRLEYHFPSLFCARYGGDEFLVTVNCGECERPKLLVENLQKELAELNHRVGTQYELSLVAGYVRADHGDLRSKDVIIRADKMLYVEKRKYHAKVKE